MLAIAVSFVACAWGLVVLKLAGDNKRTGWALGVINELIWIAYAIWILHPIQWGLIVGSLLWTGMYLRNFHKWKGLDNNVQ